MNVKNTRTLSMHFPLLQWSPSIVVSTLLEPQSCFGDKPLKVEVFCPEDGTAVLKGLRNGRLSSPWPLFCAHYFSAFCHVIRLISALGVCLYFATMILDGPK